MRVDILVRLQHCLEPVSYAAIEEDCTGFRVIEVFDDSDKVGADVFSPYGWPRSCVGNPVESFLEVCECIVEVLLVLVGWSPAGMSTHRLHLISGKDHDRRLRRSRRHCQHWKQNSH